MEISLHHHLEYFSVFKETEQDDTLHHQIDRSSSLSDVSNFILNTFTSFSLSLILGIRYLKKSVSENKIKQLSEKSVPEK
jgi:hypothetical protein